MAFAVVSIVGLWVVTTYMFWVGYAGDDDLFYARYAYLLHRPPSNWWEFRLPAVLAMRASFAAFGPSELAASVPTLLSSLVILACVAWQVDWLKRPGWETTLAVLIACTLPLDVGFRSVPLAGFVAAGLLCVGTVCVLRGHRRLAMVGPVLLAAGFATHEVSFFYVAIFCLTLLTFDVGRFWKAVATCIAVSGALLGIECLGYYLLLGDGFARLRTAAATTATLQVGVDPDTHMTGTQFFLWPVRSALFSKPFGVDLLLFVTTGIAAWRRLEQDQKILLCTTLGVYLWLGYGTQVPWSYKPFYRQFHYYFPLTLGVAAVLPFAVRHAVGRHGWVGRGLLLAALGIHMLCLGLGGRWGENVNVSRQLLQYATQRPSQQFVTDVGTMNHMYVLLGFRLPANVVCVNGPAVEHHLLLNKEPPATVRFSFPDGRVDGLLLNLEEANQRPLEVEFQTLLKRRPEHHLQIAPVRYRPVFVPLLVFLEPQPYMIRSLGGVLVSP
jgi:hypothetical protein